MKNYLADLWAATRILVNEGVIDGFGHVSIRNPENPNHYYMIPSNLLAEGEDPEFLELSENSDLVSSSLTRPSIERFIHGELYRARPDVHAVVHTHSPALIPFGVSTAKLQPLYHMCGFMHSGVPVFDIADDHGPTNMLITSVEKGQSLAKSINQSSLVLMRGHGATVVGASVQEAVYRAIYATNNAQQQPTAQLLGDVKFLSTEEAKLADELHHHVLYRPWNYWKQKCGITT